MPDSLLFDGSDDVRIYSPGSLAGNGALSIGMIVKPANDIGGTHFGVNWNSSAAAGFGIGNSLLWAYDGTSERNLASPTLLIDEWYLLGFSKAIGTVTPRGHVFRYSTSTWTHGNLSGTMANFPALTFMHFMEQSGEDLAGNLLIAGGWDADVSDGTFETLELDKASWIVAAPDEAWRFDKTGVITPFVGTSTETNNIGGTLDTGDAPAGWDDAGVSASLPNIDKSRFPKPKLRYP